MNTHTDRLALTKSGKQVHIESEAQTEYPKTLCGQYIHLHDVNPTWIELLGLCTRCEAKR